jgi:hypothetical protein
MKKLIVCAALIVSAFLSKDASAQVRVNVNFNIGAQPVWGPVGYDYVEYYYLPDIESYYYVPTRQFVYMSGGRWIFSYNLPSRYRSYDLYSGYKVVVNRPRAYRYFNDDRVRYQSYRGNRSQVVIRNSNDVKYYKVKGHPKYKHSDGRGNGKGNGKGRNKH